MKIITFKRIAMTKSPQYRSHVITEDSDYYYYYDKHNNYSRINKIEENRSFSIHSNYGGME